MIIPLTLFVHLKKAREKWVYFTLNGFINNELTYLEAYRLSLPLKSTLKAVQSPLLSRNLPANALLVHSIRRRVH